MPRTGAALEDAVAAAAEGAREPQERLRVRLLRPWVPSRAIRNSLLRFTRKEPGKPKH